jgi:hypothetical protein
MFYEPTGALHSTSENAERFGYCEVLLTGRQQVTFTGTPATIASSMARTPSRVPGILINKFGRWARSNNSLAAETVQAVSWANSGETSMKPSHRRCWCHHGSAEKNRQRG